MDDPQLNQLVMVEGRAPQTDQEVAINKKLAEDNELQVGDSISVQDLFYWESSQEMTIVGLTGIKSSAGNAILEALVSFTVFTPTTATNMVFPGADEEVFSSIAISLQDSADIESIQAAIAEVLPESIEFFNTQEFLEEEQDEDEFAEVISFTLKVLLTFIALAMLVGIFVIINTFNVLLAQRARELALLRLWRSLKPRYLS